MTRPARRGPRAVQPRPVQPRPVQSVLTRIRPAPVPPGRRALRDVRHAGRRGRALARRRPRGPGAAVHLPARARCCSPPGARRCATGQCRPLPPLEPRRCRSGTTCRSPSAWRSSSATRARPGRRRSTRARPARPSRSCRWTPGTRWWRPARRSPRSPDVEALLVRMTGRGRRVPGPDRRLLRAGRPSAPALAGVRRRPGRRAPARGFFDRIAAQRRRWRAVTELAFDVLDVAPEPHAAAPDCCSGSGSASRPARPCTRSRCGPRSASSRSAGAYAAAEADR